MIRRIRLPGKYGGCALRDVATGLHADAVFWETWKCNRRWVLDTAARRGRAVAELQEDGDAREAAGMPRGGGVDGASAIDRPAVSLRCGVTRVARAQERHRTQARERDPEGDDERAMSGTGHRCSLRPRVARR